MTRLALAFLFAACLLGCTGGGAAADGGGDGGPDNPDGGGSRRTVSGKRLDLHLLDARELPRPVDLSAVTVAALLPSATGELAVLPGTGRADGTFSIPDVPAGPYYLRVGNSYVVTSASQVELIGYRAGRPDARRADAGTRLKLDLTNLAPWQTGKDTMMLLSQNAGAAGYSFEGGLTPRLADAGTRLQGSFDYTSRVNPPVLLEGAQGDALILVQLAGRVSDAGVEYLAASRYFRAEPTLADGQETALSGAFEPVALTRSQRLLWKRSELDAMHPMVGPGATAVPPWYVTVTASRHDTMSLPSQVMNFIGQPGTTDVDLGGLEFGNPFPLDWRLSVSITGLWQVSPALPGTSPASLYVRYREYADLSLLTVGAARPSRGPVRAILVSGAPTQSPVVDVGLTPLLAWTEPVQGPATGYVVTVHGLSEANGATRISAVAQLVTPQTQLRLPPGILQTGGTYLFEVAALTGPALDLETRPWSRPLPYSSASAVTGLVSP